MIDNITTIIQARMGSTRLPGKVLLPIIGKPMLWYIVTRLRSVKTINKVIIATSNKTSDDPIVDFGKEFGIDVYRGSEEDVLDRFYEVSNNLQSQHLIRITADCPLVDPDIVSQLIDLYKSGKYDYCAVATGAGVAKEKNLAKFPDGLDAEIFSFNLLETAWKETSKPTHREHVTSFMWNHPERFKIAHLKNNTDYSNIRLTVDNEEDFELVNWIYSKLFPQNPNFKLDEIIKLLKGNQDKLKINSIFIGKEGYEQLWD